MIGLDTNIIVRYLTHDDPVQWQQAEQIIQSGERCFIPNIVLCELVWVLKGKPYHIGKDEILDTLILMLQTPVFCVRKYLSRLPCYSTYSARHG